MQTFTDSILFFYYQIYDFTALTILMLLIPVFLINFILTARPEALSYNFSLKFH